MDILSDAALMISFLNFLTIVGNVYYFSRIGKIRVTTDVINSLNAELEAKNTMLKERISEADNYKRQYDALLIEHQRLEGQLKTYRTFHEHPHTI